MPKLTRKKLSEVFNAKTIENAEIALNAILRDTDEKTQSARMRAVELTCHYAYGKPVTAFTKSEVVAALRGHDGPHYAKMTQGEVVAAARRRAESLHLFAESIGNMSAEDWAKARKELAG